MLGADGMKQLQKLLKSGNGESDSEDENEAFRAGGAQQLGPGDIGALKSAKQKKKHNEKPDEHVKSCSYAPLQKPESTGPNTIEEWEKQQEAECENLLESRPQPEYKISYKQTVGTEDLFLQMNGKTPSTASCENMIVEVFLTGEKGVGIHHIDLTVREQQVLVKSPKYFLDLQLPHRIDPDKGNAAWLSEEKILKLTLKMEREYDFVNF
ncbi:dynein axonemal assembly factor 6 [Ochlerotatus camptorhynchus]|uniref:dynein axonemal assembly factor 6 n=1 Tax=Ochlerotatus camptorhynchus TaxID=644619 RepID=UPI0031CDE879